MDYQERLAHFRTHAAAMLTADQAGADRVQRLIYPDHFLAHHMFVFALFSACVAEHFGEDLDRVALAAFMRRIRQSHPRVSPLKTEALIRVLYGEAQLFAEIPQVDHLPSMWATCQAIVGSEATEDRLAALYDLAEEAGREMVVGVFESEALYSFGQAPGEE